MMPNIINTGRSGHRARIKTGFYQRGSALSETVFFAVTLIPLLLLTPNIGKMADAKMATIEASRYAVWERTVSTPAQKSDEEIRIEMQNRFFMHPDLLLESDRGGVVDGALSNSFWRTGIDEDGDPVLSISGGSAVTLQLNNRDIPGSSEANDIAEGISNIGGALDSIISNADWDLNERGFYEARVSAEAINALTGDTGQDCDGNTETDAACLNSLYAMLIDDWSAGSPDQVERRVRALVPAGALEPLGNMISHLGNVPVFEELEHMDDMFGRVEVDVLPEDRHGDP